MKWPSGRLFRGEGHASPWHTDTIIRDELFSIDRLEQHAASLAEAQRPTTTTTARPSLNARLNDNETVLLAAYRAIAAAVDRGEPITPAAEWLIDNYHLVEEQIREINQDLPPRFYRQLPKLASGPFAGYPRVFGIAWAVVAHSDSRFDPEALRRFVNAYQRVEPLTIGELWAVAITLRIVLVENLRRAAQRIVGSRAARQRADDVADRLLGVNGRTAEPDVLTRHYQGDDSFSEVFVVQVVKRLRDQDPRVTPALLWLEEQLAAQGSTSDGMVHDEHQRQGAANVTVRNIITSMRLISDVNWPDFFEEVSLVDEVLRAARNYSSMDFATRNLYRTAIEKLAAGSHRTELEIARAALAASRIANEVSLRESDPGYHLLSGGRRAFEQAMGYRAPPGSWLRRLNAAVGPIGYISAVLVLAAVVLAIPLFALADLELVSSSLTLLALLGLVPALDVAVAIVNRSVTRRFAATLLPGLALREGVPPSLRTLVVVPTLLTSPAEIEAQIESLDVHYLASGQGEVYFALLSDWTDSKAETSVTDDALLDIARAGIAQLNLVHGAATVGDRFYLLHRRRVWSEGQRRWMGWERKRGKLHELNRLLRGATDTTFIDPAGTVPSVPADVRYVVTLDADTRLPRETVRRLVGKLAHPLNQPRFDPATRKVVEGYAVLQPRVTPSLPIGREGSTFQRVFSSMTGIDPYAAAVSDVYQDLFAEGSYAGKGIYDVDAFELALNGRVPEGSLLSHDLFEGTFARAGLVSDIEVVEEFPSRYDVAAMRQHRWARGDWQLLPWILGRGDAASRGRRFLPLLGLWKMLDNLRRTLSPPAIVLALIAGWLLPGKAAVFWTAFIFATIVLPTLLPVMGGIIPRRRSIAARSHWRALGHDLALALSQIVLTITFMAHQAWLMADAIVRTLFRLLVSRRNLLEWMTAAQAELSSQPDLARAFRHMAASPVIAILSTLAIVWLTGEARWVAIPFIVFWSAAPVIARWVSVSPLMAGRLAVSAADGEALRLVARRTWRYFEKFVTVQEHSLPPDNFQEDPHPVVAHRTSPTNIGLYLLCVVSARDFGWAGTATVVERLEATLKTMQSLQRHRGHFYNWYDTRDLRPLDPRYVSSVDSGNLAAHLIAVANACRECANTPVTSAVFLAGVRDGLCLVREAVVSLPVDRRTHVVTPRQIEDTIAALDQALSAREATAEGSLSVSPIAVCAAIMADAARALAGEQDDDAHGDVLFWAEATQRSIGDWYRELAHTPEERRSLERRLLAIESSARALALGMEFDFLLDAERKLLAIGYNAAEGMPDSSCYDLLASEARLASFFAIAKNDVPARHWFRLGRAVVPIGPGVALISWSGSMFEYLMPSLVMRAPTGSLLERTNNLIVRRQIAYGETLGVPWGVSESAYSARDLELTYQYSNFGVPGLGLKRGLSENVVIAPYATGLAAMVDPHAAARNFARLTSVGARGQYGYYEALDYTRSRLPQGAEMAIVRAFMAHHQGMTVVAIANVMFDGRMRARFHAESNIQATELLLQERTPRLVSITHPRAEEVSTAPRTSNALLPEVGRVRTTRTATPMTHLLSNGRYAVMLSSAGSGYSRWREFGLTRWREDTTRDDTGSFIYLRDVEDGAVWSAGFQPCGVEPDSYDVTFAEDRAEYIRRDGTITTTLQVVVSSEDDAEVRRILVANTGDRSRDIDITSYCELVLATPAADAAHPAFSKLFVQTEYVAKLDTLLATRRRRSPAEPEMWMAHHAVVEGEVLAKPEYETDRARFLGRGREVHAPVAIMDGRRLSNTSGTVLDPVFALRYRIRIPPGATAKVSFWTAVAATRTEVLDMLDKHHDANAFMRAATLAWTQAQVQLRHLGITAEAAGLFQRLAGHVLYADGSLRPPSDAIRRSGGAQSALWAHGISGDVPLVLLRIDHIDDLGVARELLQAHEYWRLKQLAVDLVLLNERTFSYVQDLQIALEGIVRMSQSRLQIGADSTKGSVFVLRSDLMAPETRAVLSSVARAVFVGQRGSLAEQLERRAGSAVAAVGRRQPATEAALPVRVAVPPDLEFFNGMGGFAADGREYVTCLEASRSTPAPWINVIANPHFGFQVAVEGSGYTWSVNSREHQLTQWSNDPVTDRPGEVLYVRDEETGRVWGPTVAPVRDEEAAYTVRHGQGYSRFEYEAHGIALELTVYVPLEDSIKISRLRVRNVSPRPRSLSVTAYVEWVLGTNRSASAPFVATEMDAETGAMFARNPWNPVYASRVAFADLAGKQTAFTGDRTEFLGRHGRLEAPAALYGTALLSGRTGAGLDPCCALQTPVDLRPGETTEIVFFLGEAISVEAARVLVMRYRSADLDDVLKKVRDYWDHVLGSIQVKTPDRSMDIMLNRWLLYQTLVCRLWARSAFYQASGAYGFRDQLQDGMALATVAPALTREHLLRASARQFPEGDVQHWWLPPTGQGVRTRISDDRIWLGFTAAHYLATSGDWSILDEDVAFIEGAKLAAGDHDAYYLPGVAEDSASFFEHCARGLDAALMLGVHGLPLIGTGDWNDGMNRVGELGRGESVWLGWLLYSALIAFAPVARMRNESARAARWEAHAASLRDSLELEGWDGAWYRRGYFDDGTPFGSASNEECRIDSIAQSWSVISGAADSTRAAQAMTAVDEHLILRDDSLALLFTPPFDRTALEPGYVKGYPPGIRENGGQYTHAAAWSVIALTKLGEGNKAGELFSLLNPVNHTSTRAGLRRYKVEPYVVAADIYSVAPHAGRGGWTWYTGSAGWLFRAGLENILGFVKQGDELLLSPCIPAQWPQFEISFRYLSARYQIAVANPGAVSRGIAYAAVDGVPLPPGMARIKLVDDGLAHQVEITLG